MVVLLLVYVVGDVLVLFIKYGKVNLVIIAVVGGLHWQVIKYISRAWLKKDPYEDFCKARWYLNRLINTLATEAYQDR